MNRNFGHPMCTILLFSVLLSPAISLSSEYATTTRTIPRLHFPSTLLSPSCNVLVPEERREYVQRVLRLGPGRKKKSWLRGFNAASGEWLLEFLSPDELIVRSQIRGPCKQSPTTKLDVLFVPIRPSRQRTLLEKCVELNVNSFTSCSSDLSQNDYTEAASRWGRKHVENTEQSERLHAPPYSVASVKVKEFVSDWLNRSSLEETLLICRARSDKALSISQFFAKSKPKPTTSVTLLVGPEGGWSPEEECYFDEISPPSSERICSVSLGRNVLRSETACIAAVAVAQEQLQIMERESE